MQCRGRDAGPKHFRKATKCIILTDGLLSCNAFSRSLALCHCRRANSRFPYCAGMAQHTTTQHAQRATPAARFLGPRNPGTWSARQAAVPAQEQAVQGRIKAVQITTSKRSRLVKQEHMRNSRQGTCSAGRAASPRCAEDACSTVLQRRPAAAILAALRTPPKHQAPKGPSHPRALCQRPRNRHPLLLPAAETAGGPFGELRQPNLRQRVRHRCVHCLGGEAVPAGGR